MKKILILVLLMSVSCDPPGDNRLTFANNSSSALIFTKGPIEDAATDPFRYYECSSRKNTTTYVKPGTKNNYPTSPGENWETLIPKYPTGSLLFLAYDADTAITYIDRFGCDSLAKRKDLVLKRFEVTVDYLNINNWTLTYP